MKKDQATGGVILAICTIVALGYLILVSVPSYFGMNTSAVRIDAVLVLVSAAFIAILVIGGWIGYTMATTPAPKPIEEITPEENDENENVPPKQ